MKREATALLAISKRLGESKFNELMGGAMMPHGNISTAEVLSIIYGGEVSDWEKQLSFHSEHTFKRLCKRPQLGKAGND